MLLMTVAEAAPLRARQIGVTIVLVRSPGRFDVTLRLEIVIKVPVDNVL
jgi:hypothetical protein